MKIINLGDNMKKIISNLNCYKDKEERKIIIKQIESKFKEIFDIMGYDLQNDQQIIETPKRIAKMWVNELFVGNFDEEPNITFFDNTKNYDEMIILDNVELKSTCSHHFLPFIGKIHIAYIPDKKIVGISKLVRIVRWFMRRPQIQEELTKQIADYLEQKLAPKGIAVLIEAQHLCMLMRGVEETNSSMKTSELRGVFREEKIRKEFFDIIKEKK